MGTNWLEVEITAIANERGLDFMDPEVRKQIRAELRPPQWFVLQPFKWLGLLLLGLILFPWRVLVVSRCLALGCPGGRAPGGHPTGGDYDYVDVTHTCERCGRTTTRRHHR